MHKTLLIFLLSFCILLQFGCRKECPEILPDLAIIIPFQSDILLPDSTFSLNFSIANIAVNSSECKNESDLKSSLTAVEIDILYSLPDSSNFQIIGSQATQVEHLDAGEIENITFVSPSAVSGTYKMLFHVDSNNMIPERDEGNNQGSFIVNVL